MGARGDLRCPARPRAPCTRPRRGSPSSHSGLRALALGPARCAPCLCVWLGQMLSTVLTSAFLHQKWTEGSQLVPHWAPEGLLGRREILGRKFYPWLFSKDPSGVACLRALVPGSRFWDWPLTTPGALLRTWALELESNMVFSCLCSLGQVTSPL